jgi:uncharacterized protein (TIGR00255 family)
MKSNNGYGHREVSLETRTYTVELKSYNNRYLDIYVTLPHALSSLEPRVRAFLGERVLRGKVECSVALKEREEDLSVSLDTSLLKTFLPVLQDLKKAAGIREPIRLEHLLKIEGILKVQKNREAGSYWEELETILTGAFEEYEAARVREGEGTCRDVVSSLRAIEEAKDFFKSRAGDMEDEIKKNIRERFKALLDDNYDENRVLAETALLLMKYSINEEIVRLEQHIAGFREGMAAPGSAGKKLDFICQEMGREINTIGSKSAQGDVIRGVVSCKDHLERIREQLRNLE